MASITRRVGVNGVVTYRARVRIRGVYRSQSFTRKADAETWVSSVENDARQDRRVPTQAEERATVGELIKTYLDALPRQGPRADHGHVRQQLAWWASKIGHIKALALRKRDVIRARDTLLKESTNRGGSFSSGTINRYVARLHRVFEFAATQDEWNLPNPIKGLKLREPPGRDVKLTDEQIRTLLAACQKHGGAQLHCFVTLALATTGRRSEILDLRWADVDLKTGRAMVSRSKNGDGKTLHIGGHALDVLKEWAKVRRLDTDLVFPARCSKSPTRKKRPLDLKMMWDRTRKSVGLPDLRIHDLRHVAISRLAESGASLNEIAAVSGHRTMQMVKRYAHLADKHSASVVQRMNDALFRSVTVDKDSEARHGE